MPPMNRTALLLLAAQHTDPAPAAAEMGRPLTSAESVHAAVHSRSTKAAFLERWVGVLIGVCFLSFLVAFFVTGLCVLSVTPSYRSESSPMAIVALEAIVLCFCVLLLSIVVSNKAARLRKELALLKPVVAAKDCSRALEYIEAGAPEGLAWHAQAVAERGVLSEFDVAVLRDIHYAAKAVGADEAARQKLYAKAAIPPAEA